MASSQPRGGRAPQPGRSFRQLADVLATGDTKLYRPSESRNATGATGPTLERCSAPLAEHGHWVRRRESPISPLFSDMSPLGSNGHCRSETVNAFGYPNAIGVDTMFHVSLDSGANEFICEMGYRFEILLELHRISCVYHSEQVG